MTLGKGMQQYLWFHTHHKGGSHASVETYERVFRMFLAHVTSAGLRDEPASFNRETVRTWTVAEQARGVGPRTLASRLHMLGSLAQYLLTLEDGRKRPLLAEDPTRALKKPKFKKPETKFLYPAEAKNFLSAECHTCEVLPRDLFFNTMCRVSELTNANVGDLVGPDANGRYALHVLAKGGNRQIKPVSNDIAEALLVTFEKREAKRTDPLLVNRHGQRWTRTGLSAAMVRLGRKAGVVRFNVSAHKIRHTAATGALAGGVNPQAVS
ncbi:MAG: tyrosine-type recombinase/integrase, partial [Gammaproteobacteria bacterium]